MTYHSVARTSDIAPGAMRGVVVEGKKILIAHIDGQFFAMQQKCPHLGGNLCKGKLKGRAVTCPLHAASFDLATGEVLEGAHLLFLKFKTKAATTYPVMVEAGEVLVEA